MWSMIHCCFLSSHWYYFVCVVVGWPRTSRTGRTPCRCPTVNTLIWHFSMFATAQHKMLSPWLFSLTITTITKHVSSSIMISVLSCLLLSSSGQRQTRSAGEYNPSKSTVRGRMIMSSWWASGGLLSSEDTQWKTTCVCFLISGSRWS